MKAHERRAGASRREFLRLAAGVPLASPPLASLARVDRRPNVILFVADDLGSGDLSSYGCPDIRTPRIDSIGRRGVRFTHAYSNGPECSPTRTALLTGRYQQRAGGLECAIGLDNVGRYDEAVWLRERNQLGLPSSEPTVPQLLKRAGYQTACFGKWHLGYEREFWPFRHGFDQSFGILGGGADYFTHREPNGRNVLYQDRTLTRRDGYVTDLIVEAAVDWLKRTRPAPFFLYVPFTSPHTPIQDPEGFDAKLGSAPERQGDRAVYARMVERMDAAIGGVLDQLERMAAADNTLVIFISDNGADANGRNHPLRGRKSSLWEGGIRIPCLMRWPARLPEGQTNAPVALTMDLLPTILAATGAAAPGGRNLDGVNILPNAGGEGPARPRTLFWRSKRGTRVRRAARHGDMKLVIDDGAEELHDLAADEQEQRDLSAERPETAAILKRKLLAWETEVRAPRLRPFYAARG